MKWYVFNWDMKDDRRIDILGMIHNYDGIQIDMVRKHFSFEYISLFCFFL
jgi:hypothetical protein